MDDQSRSSPSHMAGMLSKAVNKMSNSGHLNLEAISPSAPALTREVYSLLTRDQRIQAFDMLINISNQPPRHEYIDAVRYLGRFLLMNKYTNECYIFLTVCQEKNERMYGEPVDYTLYEEVGNMFYITGQQSEAIKWYERIMRVNGAPETRMYFNIGMCHQSTNNFTHAIEAYLKSINADPSNAKAQINLGYCQMCVGNYEKAMQTYQQLPPDNFEACLGIGNAMLKAGNTEDAIAMYLQAIEIKDEYGAYNNLGCALKKAGLLQDAINAYNDSLTLHPNQEAASNLIALYIEVGKASEAAGLLSNCTKLLPMAEVRSFSRLVDDVKPVERGLNPQGGKGGLNAIRATMLAKSAFKKHTKTPDMLGNSSSSNYSQIRMTTKSRQL